MSWFVEGQAGERDKFVKDAYRLSIFNFWMKQGETREIVFLDDVRFGVYEHVIPYMGKFKNFTCGGSNCVLCGMEKPRTYKEYYTVLDLTPFRDKEGKERKFSRKALSVGKTVMEVLQSRRGDAGGSLLGCKFRVSRTGAKSPSCGNDWVFLSKVDLTKVPQDVQPYDFRDVLRPRPNGEVESILKFADGGEAKTVTRSSLTGSDHATDAVEDTSDIPF